MRPSPTTPNPTQVADLALNARMRPDEIADILGVDERTVKRALGMHWLTKMPDRQDTASARAAAYDDRELADPRK